MVSPYASMPTSMPLHAIALSKLRAIIDAYQYEFEDLEGFGHLNDIFDDMTYTLECHDQNWGGTE